MQFLVACQLHSCLDTTSKTKTKQKKRTTNNYYQLKKNTTVSSIKCLIPTKEAKCEIEYSLSTLSALTEYIQFETRDDWTTRLTGEALHMALQW